MCIGVPGRVLEITVDGKAQVLLAGIAREVDIAFLTGEDSPRVGDFVLVHVGYAMGKMSVEEALETERMLEEFIQASGPDEPQAVGAAGSTPA
jgi:hydrogenase expression/formation protein HypC